MQKFYSRKLFSLGMLMAGVIGAGQANAQYASEIVGARLIVETPAIISGVKQFTYSSNPAMTGPWGAPLTTHEHVQVVRPDLSTDPSDSLGCSSVTGVAGNWVLIYRGDCEFGVKALNAEQSGAAGIVIWNHTDHELINMAAGSQGASVTIPVIFVTKADGKAMAGQIAAGEDVYISITGWGFNKTHDLALIQGSPAPTPGLAIPHYQLDDGIDIPQYRGFTGATVANTGASVETNVKVISTVTYTPQGGATTPFYQDTAEIASFAPNDSVVIAFSDDFYNFTNTAIGRYDVEYTVVADDADEYSADNSGRFSFDVTPNAYSRGAYDAVNQVPIVAGYTRIGAANIDWSWGPMFYNRVGGYTLQSIKLAITDQDTADHSLQSSAGGTFLDASIFKWNDANSDGYATGNELDLVGTAVYTFAATDSPGTMLELPIGEPGTGNPMTVVSQNNSHYWVAVNLGTQFNLSVYRDANYYVRQLATKNTTTPVNDFVNPGIMTSTLNIQPGDSIRLIAYGVTTANSSVIDSADYLQQDAVPAVSLMTSLFSTSVPAVSAASNELSVYPNPAVNTLNVKINLAKSTEKVYIKIMDAMGRQVSLTEVENAKDNDVAISISNLAPGTYYAVMIDSDRALARKFIVGVK